MAQVLTRCLLTSSKKILIFGISLFGGLHTVHASELKILMLRDGSKPYSETTSGDVLATFNKAVLGQLLMTSNAYELRSGLLKSWQWNSKDLSYELFLRENLTFHDGSHIKSEDLEFALLRGFFSKQRSFYEIYLGNILGVEKIKPGTKYSSGIVEGVKITGPLSVKVKLKNPNPSFLYSLTAPFFSLVKKTALNEDLITWKALPIGAGDYKVVSEDQNKVSLQSLNGNKFEKIILYKKIVPNVSYDISFHDLEQKMKTFVTENPSAIFTLFFTNQNKLSAIDDFRQAIKFGVDRNSLVSGNENLHPAFEFLTTTFWKNDKSINSVYDLQKARQYFSKLPEKLKSKTWKIPVFSFGDFSEEKKTITTRLTKQFAEFGFKVAFYPSAEKFLSKTSATESPFRLSGRVCDNIDPLLMFSSFRTRSPYEYDNSQNDSVYDSVFEEAAKAASTEDRVSSLRKISMYTITKNFMVPLYESNQVYYINPETIESLGSQTNPIVLQLDEIKMK